MHCYFLRKNQIAGVTFLRAAPEAGLVRQAEAAFQAHAEHEFDGFEIWAGERLVYRHRPIVDQTTRQDAVGPPGIGETGRAATGVCGMPPIGE